MSLHEELGAMRRLAANLRRDLERVGQSMPTCPECGETLNMRLHHRRFIEDNRYVECAGGHVWRLFAESPRGDVLQELHPVHAADEGGESRAA